MEGNLGQVESQRAIEEGGAQRATGPEEKQMVEYIVIRHPSLTKRGKTRIVAIRREGEDPDLRSARRIPGHNSYRGAKLPTPFPIHISGHGLVVMTAGSQPANPGSTPGVRTISYDSCGSMQPISLKH